MKKVMLIVSFVAVILSVSCVKIAVKFVGDRQAASVEKKHGPMEKWGARCDVEINDLNYAPGEKGGELLTLDMHFNKHSETQPIVVNIHGGGWVSGDKRAVNSVFRSKYIAARGYVVANINYRMLPDYDIRTQVEDVMGAVIWVKEHAADFNADPQRVGVTGGSAGGHLTSMVAWASDDDFFVPTGHAKSAYDSDVSAAVPFYGLYDIERALEKTSILKYFTGLRSFLMIKKGPERDKIIRKLSPKYHVSPDIPPTLFVCGDEDNLGLYPDSVDFEKILRETGVETGLHIADGGKHGFDIKYADEITQKALEATVEWFDRFLKP